MLKNTDAPAVLVETVFIDNPDDAKLLVDREDDFARAIARAVTDYFQNEKPLPDVVDVPKKTSSRDRFSEYFEKSEFVCHCCGRDADKIDPRLVELLEQLSTKAGKSVHLNCAYRCSTHNAQVGGVPNSQHVSSTAAEITIPEIGFERARELVESIDFDDTGFYPPLDGDGARFIHVDVRDGGVDSHIVWCDKKNSPSPQLGEGFFVCLQADNLPKNYG